MVLTAASIFAMAALLILLAMFTSTETSSRLRKAAFIIASEIGYFLVVFLTPNIINAFFL